MTDQEFDELLRKDRDHFYLKGHFAPLKTPIHINQKKRRRYRLIKDGIAASVAIVLMGGGIMYATTSSQRGHLPAKTTGATYGLAPAVVKKMANYTLQFHYSFPVYIPLGGLNTTDYIVRSMTSQPSFTLFSQKKQEWINISEYASTSDPAISSLSWTAVTDKKSGAQYWMHSVHKHIDDYYFKAGTTVIVIQNNDLYGKPVFPQRLMESLKPLYAFTNSN